MRLIAQSTPLELIYTWELIVELTHAYEMNKPQQKKESPKTGLLLAIEHKTF
jgi:hypothetical protein